MFRSNDLNDHDKISRGALSRPERLAVAAFVLAVLIGLFVAATARGKLLSHGYGYPHRTITYKVSYKKARADSKYAVRWWNRAHVGYRFQLARPGSQPDIVIAKPSVPGEPCLSAPGGEYSAVPGPSVIEMAECGNRFHRQFAVAYFGLALGISHYSHERCAPVAQVIHPCAASHPLSYERREIRQIIHDTNVLSHNAPKVPRIQITNAQREVFYEVPPLVTVEAKIQASWEHPYLTEPQVRMNSGGHTTEEPCGAEQMQNLFGPYYPLAYIAGKHPWTQTVTCEVYLPADASGQVSVSIVTTDGEGHELTSSPAVIRIPVAESE